MQQSLLAAERHYAAEGPWYYMNYWLGVPSTLLAALAGASAVPNLQAPDWLPVAAGLLAASLTSLLTFLDPHKRASAHHSAGRNYEALYHAAGFFERFELITEGSDASSLQTRIKKLNTDFDELLRSSPAIPGRAYIIAHRNLTEATGEVLRVEDPSHS
jgi:hypothetical protein